jgi:excisionase family DNA binding protein
MANEGADIGLIEEGLVELKVAAKRLNVSRSLLYKMIKGGKIPCYRIGSALRFNMGELRQALRR